MITENTEHQDNMNPPLVVTDVLAQFNAGGSWISRTAFNKWMEERGFEVTTLERDNRTDGEVHHRYSHKATGKSYEFHGNYWQGSSFGKVVEWLNQQGL
jgi:hypothetical protein